MTIERPHVFYVKALAPRFGCAFRDKDIKTGFNSALRRAGIKDFNFHDIRHCIATHLIMSGIDLTTVKKLLGHKSPAITLRYAHLAPAHKVAALSVLDSTLNQEPTIQKLYSPPNRELPAYTQVPERIGADGRD